MIKSIEYSMMAIIKTMMHVLPLSTKAIHTIAAIKYEVIPPCRPSFAKNISGNMISATVEIATNLKISMWRV